MTAELGRVKEERNWESIDDNNYNKNEENVRVKEERDLEGNARGQYWCVEIAGDGECASKLSTNVNVSEEFKKEVERDSANADVCVRVKEERDLEGFLRVEIEDKECSPKLSPSIKLRDQCVKKTEEHGKENIFLNSEVYVSVKIESEFEDEPGEETERLPMELVACELRVNRTIESNEADAVTNWQGVAGVQGCHSEGQDHSKSNENVFGLKNCTITRDLIGNNEPQSHQKTQAGSDSTLVINLTQCQSNPGDKPRKIRKNKTLERPYECDVCGKRFAKKSNMSLHVQIHKELVQYPCDVCKKQYSSYFNLKRHKKIHTGERPHHCDVCDRRFTDPCNLATHMKRMHSKPDSTDAHVGRNYTCKICNKQFLSPSHLNSHKRVHTGEKPYPCNVCDKLFTSASNLKRHKISHTGEKPYTCDMCNKQYMDIHALTNHIKNHMGVAYMYGCDNCKKQFRDPRTLARHKQIHKGETFTCEICNKKYFSKATFVNHKTYHKLKAEGRYNKMEIAGGAECASKLSKNVNVREESKKEVERESAKEDVCVRVKEERDMEGFLRVEMEEDKEYSPKLSPSINLRDECVKKTEEHGKENIFLNSEVKVESEFEHEPVEDMERLPIEVVACELRVNRTIESNEADAMTNWHGVAGVQGSHSEGQDHSKSIENAFGLRNCTITRDLIGNNEPHSHQKTQAGSDSTLVINLTQCQSNPGDKPRKIRKNKTLERPYECDVCGKRFAKKSNMSLHVQIHKELVQYPCDVCKKQYSSYYNLKRHKKIHTGERPHCCDVCDRRFTDPCNLATHMKRIHSTTDSTDADVGKNYTCKICNKLFPSPSHLNSHKRVHTGEKPYPCNVCDKLFTSASNLKRHKISHTGEKPYTCDMCNKQYMDIHALTNHIKNHMGVAYMYGCDNCKKQFRDPRTLARHKQIHKGETFTCEICNKKYFSKPTFVNHKAYHKLKAAGRYKGRKYIRVSKETK